MTPEKVIMDLGICKLSRNPNKSNIRNFIEGTFDVFKRYASIRSKVEKMLTDYFANVSYPNIDTKFQVGGLTNIEINLITLLTENDNIVMVNLDHLPAVREKAIAVKITFTTRHPSIILPVSEEYNLDAYMDTDGISTKNMRKWYYVDPKYMARQPVSGFTHYPIGRVGVVAEQ